MSLKFIGYINMKQFCNLCQQLHTTKSTHIITQTQAFYTIPFLTHTLYQLVQKNFQRGFYL